MREKEVERRLVREVKKRGGICPKWVSPGFDGAPDRIALLGGGRVSFFEVKAKGRKPGALQAARHRQLRALGFRVFVLDDESSIGGILDEIQAT